MKNSTLAHLCNPYAGEPLRLDGEQLVGLASGQRFPIRHGIPDFSGGGRLPRFTRLWKLFYEAYAWAYDPVVAWNSRLFAGSEDSVRQEVIAQLPVGAGQRVLEVAAGTASNRRYLHPEADYFGVDISYRMLRRAQRNLAGWGLDAELIQADAQQLPFRNDTFDLVFSMGGVQFFDDPFQAVSEMTRVAKPGARIVVLDEARRAVPTLRRLPAHAHYASDKQAAVQAMRRLAPFSVSEAEIEILPSGEFYRLEFSKAGGWMNLYRGIRA